MSEKHSIEENDLDGALNALFLETYSQKSDAAFSNFVFQQEYSVKIDSKKEAAVLKKLGKKPRGGMYIFWLGIALLFLVSPIVLLIINDNAITHQEEALANKTAIASPSQIKKEPDFSADKINVQPFVSASGATKKLIAPAQDGNSVELTSPVIEPGTSAYADKKEEKLEAKSEQKEVPYFDEAGLAFFAKVKDKMLNSIIMISDKLYAKVEPGTVMYKEKEIIVDPFVMRNFDVSNLEYKAFLADLFKNGNMDDFRKALPKSGLWEEQGCNILAKKYFDDELYNDFPVVNVSKEAAFLFCEWLQEEVNKQPQKKSKTKGKKKELLVRLPYDHEWIYSAEVAYTLITKCDGYNTIYDPREGLVDKNFYKRTSSLSRRDKKLETRLDELSDINRYGMAEAEMIKIFQEGIAYNDKTMNRSSSAGYNELRYPLGMEACSEAGHVCEMVEDLAGSTKVIGCCWKSKDEYLKMCGTFNKRGASPFIGFRLVIATKERGTYKDPFW